MLSFSHLEFSWNCAVGSPRACAAYFWVSPCCWWPGQLHVAKLGTLFRSISSTLRAARPRCLLHRAGSRCLSTRAGQATMAATQTVRSEEHTSELQSHLNLVCR